MCDFTFGCMLKADLQAHTPVNLFSTTDIEICTSLSGTAPPAGRSGSPDISPLQGTGCLLPHPPPHLPPQSEPPPLAEGRSGQHA